MAATTEYIGEVFNVGTKCSVSIRELAEMIQDSVNGSISIEHVDARPGDIDESEADVTKTAELLGSESGVLLRDGLERLAASDESP